jgi:hypothetical protein
MIFTVEIDENKILELLESELEGLNRNIKIIGDFKPIIINFELKM